MDGWCRVQSVPARLPHASPAHPLTGDRPSPQTSAGGRKLKDPAAAKDPRGGDPGEGWGSARGPRDWQQSLQRQALAAHACSSRLAPLLAGPAHRRVQVLPQPVTPAYFSRCSPLITPQLSAKIQAQMRKGGYVDGGGNIQRERLSRRSAGGWVCGRQLFTPAVHTWHQLPALQGTSSCPSGAPSGRTLPVVGGFDGGIDGQLIVQCCRPLLAPSTVHRRPPTPTPLRPIRRHHARLRAAGLRSDVKVQELHATPLIAAHVKVGCLLVCVWHRLRRSALLVCPLIFPCRHDRAALRRLDALPPRPRTRPHPHRTRRSASAWRGRGTRR